MKGIERSLLHPDEALRIVLEQAPSPRIEEVALGAASGRALAADIVARVDDPPFDKATMDGFAYAQKGDEGAYRVLGRIAAGDAATVPLGPGECVRIMTGAPLPPGASAVQRFELSELSSSDGVEFVRFTGSEPAVNIVRRGSNRRSGEVLLSKRPLLPQDIGILASSGYGSVPVAARPRVGLVTTGTELVSPVDASGALPAAAIYDANGPLLAASIVRSGCALRDYGIVLDDEGALREAVSLSLGECDVTIVSGGVSKGDFDHVPAAVASSGARILFHGVAIKPGKPLLFAVSERGDGRAALFGLPGNPASAFVCFETMVLPYLNAVLGLGHIELCIVGADLSATLLEPIDRAETDRVEFLPARLSFCNGRPEAVPVAYGGSSDLAAFAEADCLLRAEIGEKRLEAGRIVRARRIRA
jgi:molybdopterin molybdotransferase